MLTLQIIGNLGQDPERKETQSGTKLCRFPIAANKKVKGEKVTTWVNVTCFDEKKIDFIMQYCRKGTRLFLEGEPQARAYKGKNDEPAASLDLTLGFGSKVEICASEPGDNNGLSRAGNAASSQAGNAGSQGSASNWDDDDLNDDIPF